MRKAPSILLAALLASGFGLEGKVCFGSDMSCTGTAVTCPDAANQCSTIMTQFNWGSGTSLLTMKGCATESACQILDASRSSLAEMGIHINQLKCVPASGATIVAPRLARLLGCSW